jgi:hypothetical protein
MTVTRGHFAGGGSRALWHAAGLVFVAFVVYESLAPSAIDAGTAGGMKLGHLLAYGWLMLWYAQLYPAIGSRIAIGIALVILGAGLEYAQGMTGYRSFAYSDMRDNVIGVAIGLALAATPLGGVMGRLEARRGSARA